MYGTTMKRTKKRDGERERIEKKAFACFSILPLSHFLIREKKSIIRMVFKAELGEWRLIKSQLEEEDEKRRKVIKKKNSRVRSNNRKGKELKGMIKKTSK